MQVFGHLLMRRLIAVRVLGQVVHEMIGVKDEAPEKLPEDHATGRAEGRGHRCLMEISWG